MQHPVEIDTSTGAVRASTEDLAQAVAAMIAAEDAPTFCEQDLVEAVTLDLDTGPAGGSLSDFSIPSS